MPSRFFQTLLHEHRRKIFQLRLSEEDICVEYRALTIGLTDELFSGLQAVLTAINLHLTPSLTVRDASRLLNQEKVYLLIADVEYLRNIGQVE